MSGQTNGTVVPDDDGSIPADLLADGETQQAAQPTDEDRARQAEAEAKELRDQVHAQADVIRQLNVRSANQESMLQEVLKHAKTVDERSAQAQERGWSSAIEETRFRMRKAAADADVAAHDAAERDLDILLRNQPSPSDKGHKADAGQQQLQQQQQQIDPGTRQEYETFLANNPWYNSDWEARALFDGVYADLTVNKQGMPTKDRLAEARERVIKRLPDKFPTQVVRPKAATVAQPGPQGGKSKPKAKTEADLPASARAVMERFVKQGVLTKEQYLKDYQWDN